MVPNKTGITRLQTIVKKEYPDQFRIFNQLFSIVTQSVMKKSVSAAILLLFVFPGVTQPVNQDEQIIRSIADRIIHNTSWDFIDRSNGNILSRVTQANYSPAIHIRSPYNTWNYWNGVLNIAMIDLAEFFQDPGYKQWAQKNYAFAFDNAAVFQEHYKPHMNKWTYPFGQYMVMQELDDCGAMGGGLIEVYREIKRDDYKTYLDKAAEHILTRQERLEDGTLVRSGPHRYTLWADDLYMGLVFLARMGDLTGDPNYFDEAARQVTLFTHYLFNPCTQLYYHGYYSDIGKQNVAHWGRCNGWVMLAQADLLEYLPESHPLRDQLLEIFFQQVIGVSRYQDPSGLWHQLIDKSDSYLESSCSAMFIYSIAKAVNKGWIPASYGSIARQGWKGLKTKIREDGQVKDICIGTGMEDNLVFYYERPAQRNDIHGLGAILLAGVEMLKLNNP
jgi:unsaturated rhamnogalacturonyl hydrolase